MPTRKPKDFTLNLRNFPPDLNRRLRMLALQQGKTLRQLIISSLETTAKTGLKSA